MWNDNDIFANDIAEKFEQRMFCNFGGGGSSRDNVGGGSGTGGYDVLGTGVMDNSAYDGVRVGTDPSAVGLSLRDISGGSSGDDDYVAAIQANVDAQLAQQAAQRAAQVAQQNIVQEQQAAATARALQNMQTPYERLLQTASNITSANLSGGMGNIPVLEQLAMRAGQAPRLPSQGLMSKVPSFLTTAGRKIGEVSTGKMFSDIVDNDYVPQYDSMGQIVATINPETGQYGVGSVISRIDPSNPANTAPPSQDFGGDDDGGFVAPEATAVAVAQPEPAREPNFPMDYRYPAGGIYPEEGMYQRMGLLDVAPMQFGGLLRDYGQPQFAEMNVGFRRPTDVSLFQDPYDVTGYSLV